MQYNISYSCVSHAGKVRSVNQDNIICDGHFLNSDGKTDIKFPLSGTKSSKELSLFGVFDGLGGEACGEIASYIAAKNASRLNLGDDAISDLSFFCKKTNADICNYAAKNGISSMGTTAAMLAFTEKEIVLCNIGDSKILRFHEGALEQVSVDHVTVSVFGMKPFLSQNLGIPSTEMIIEPYFAHGWYDKDDIYVICSDGLVDMVSNEEISEILTSVPFEKAIAKLLDKALANGGKDNISIILCKIESPKSFFDIFKHRISKKENRK